MSLNDTASRAMSSSPLIGIRSDRCPSANRSAVRAAARTGTTTCRVTIHAIPASSTINTRPPVAIVPRTSAIVLCSLPSGKIRYSSRLVTRDDRRGADDQRRTREAFGVHRRVLVGHLPGLDEIAQRVGQLVDGPGRGGGPRAITGHHQHRVERTGQTGAGGRVGFRRQRVAGQLQAAVQRARLFPADDPADRGPGPVDLLGGRADLDVKHAVGDLAGQHEAERQDHRQGHSERQSEHPKLQASDARPRRGLGPTYPYPASPGRNGPSDRENVASSPRSPAPLLEHRERLCVITDHGGPAL